MGRPGKLPTRPPVDLSILDDAPTVKYPYDPNDACDDLPAFAWAVYIFTNARMSEAEEYCRRCDPDMDRLLLSTAYALIHSAKAVMSSSREDMLAAIGHAKHGNKIAQQHRKPGLSFASSLAGYITGTSRSQRMAFMKSMTKVELHAELSYAESLYAQTFMGILYTGDWLFFIYEALNMRTTFNLYKALGNFIDHCDAEAEAQGDDSEDKTIDQHFRSGVYLGVGLSHLVLSLLPQRLVNVVQLFGFHGDRHEGLKILCRAGGWTEDNEEPSIRREESGVRRSICDIFLLLFHLVVSEFTFEGVNLAMAQKIIKWNLKYYPDGGPFLFAAGRMALMQRQPHKAIEFQTRAIEAQTQYLTLHHASYWEMTKAYFALADIAAALECWRVLEAESTWSKAVYTYAMAICLWEVGKVDEASALMVKVTGLRQKVAGKSIPLEKLVARKARQFLSQGNRLALPTLEFASWFECIAYTPQHVLLSKMLPAVEALLLKLEAYESRPEEYEDGRGFWDDYCLGKYMQGLCLRHVAHLGAHAIADAEDISLISKADAERQAIDAFESVFAHGTKIQLDHYIVYSAHYELGRLLACMGDLEGSRRHFELILSGEYLEVGPSGRKGKYSLQLQVYLRSFAALDALKKGIQMF